MNDKEQIKALSELLSKYRQGACSPEEARAIEQWFQDLFPAESIQNQDHAPIDNLADTIFDNLKDEIQLQTSKPSNSKSLAIWIGAIAACLALVVWVWNPTTSTSLSEQSLAPVNLLDGDILPGTQTAILTNSEGETIQAPDPNLSKYASEETQKDFNISTPVAATYAVQLEDGTRVWLNAESSLRYPSRFDKKERRVHLIGEAYFEVKTDRNRPFIIEAAQTTIEVLGTTFNVNAYQKEVLTTLIEGSVKIHSLGMNNILRPGEQAWCHSNRLDVSPSDLNKNLAWHRGEFYFDGSNLTEVCQQISRWYDVDFEGIDHTAVHSSFKGSIDRNQSLSKVLKILSVATGMQFDIQGRKIIADLMNHQKRKEMKGN
ncbi:MAG: FecR family protein [Sphingobacteriaceae bacterium]